MPKKLNWPKIEFSNCGTKISTEVLQALDPLHSLSYFEFLQKWNGGTPIKNCFKVLDASGNLTLGEVIRFFGISSECGAFDVRDAVFRYWDYLPRSALPIAEIAIGDQEWDQRLLVTFRWGPFLNQIFLLPHPHAGGPEAPDDLSNLQKVANSLPEFLKSLASREYWLYRTWYKLPIPSDQLNLVAAQLLKSGLVDPLKHFGNIAKRKSAVAYHPTIGFGVWLAHPGETISNISPPKPIPTSQSILAIDAYRWAHPDAEQYVKRILKSVKIQQLSKLGETRIADGKMPINAFPE